MPPRASAVELADRYQVLTLHLADAVARQDTDSLRPLLEERDRVLGEIEECTMTAEAARVLAEVLAYEETLTAAMEQERSSAMREAINMAAGRRVGQAYAAASRDPHRGDERLG